MSYSYTHLRKNSVEIFDGSFNSDCLLLEGCVRTIFGGELGAVHILTGVWGVIFGVAQRIPTQCSSTIPGDPPAMFVGL